MAGSMLRQHNAMLSNAAHAAAAAAATPTGCAAAGQQLATHVSVSGEPAVAARGGQQRERAFRARRTCAHFNVQPPHRFETAFSLVAGHRRRCARLAAGERRCVARAAGQRERRASACGRSAVGARPRKAHLRRRITLLLSRMLRRRAGAASHMRPLYIRFRRRSPTSQRRPSHSARTRPRRAPLRAQRLAHPRPPAAAAPRHAGLASATRTATHAKALPRCPASCMT
jgi:hypothetical protein